MIRRAAPTDADEIGRVQAQAWRETYATLVPAALLAKHALTPWPLVLARQGEEGRGVHVAVDGGRIVGFASGGPATTTFGAYGGELYSIYLLHAAHGGGTGRALVAAVARDLAAGGHRAALCWVLGTNPARGFYERLGGRVLGHQPCSICGMD
jgi:L-amino acid N-acyltransferase YncA